MESKPKLRVCIIGDRGLPARYSGFSTLCEELAVRLVQVHGMEVTAYCRKPYYTEHPATYKGVNLVWFPAPGGKSLESILHSNLAILHAAVKGTDVAFVVDPGNGPFCLPLRAARIPVVCHTDGLGWKRTKWGVLQRKYYKWSERISASWTNWLVTDNGHMQEYYRKNYRAESTFIPYGSIVGAAPDERILAELGLEAGRYWLVVARMEPENNTDLLIREYKRSRARLPLIVVGSVPYRSAYHDAIRAEADHRVRIVGSVYDPGKLNGLYRHCFAYLHGHEVGGTNPSLLRAMGAGAACIPIDVGFNTECVGESVPTFGRETGALAALVDRLESTPAEVAAIRATCLGRSRQFYRWDAVAAAYATLFRVVHDVRHGRRDRAELARLRAYTPEVFNAGHEDWS